MIVLRDCRYAEPLRVLHDQDDCFFYHSMDVPDVPARSGMRSITGIWDLRGRFDDYVGGVDVTGKTVLDVGVATGFLSFEAERRGAAEVVGVEMPETDRPQYIPYRQAAGQPAPAEADKRILPQIRRSYWLCHALYGSRAKIVHCNVHDVGDRVAGADIVLVGQILVHVRDPLNALTQCARAAGERLVIVEGSFESAEPVMRFCGAERAPYAWFHLSTALYETYLRILGFEIRSISKASYRCGLHDVPMTELYTIVAQRIGPTAGCPAA
jgi:SAM-dependent methyltransferase